MMAAARKTTFMCNFCKKDFPTHDQLLGHLPSHLPGSHQEIIRSDSKLRIFAPGEDKAFISFEQGLESSHRVYRINNLQAVDPLPVLLLVRPAIESLVLACLHKLVACKVQVGLGIDVVRENTFNQACFWSFYSSVYNPNDMPEVLDNANEKVQNSIDAYTQKGSGWVIDRVHEVIVRIAKNEPLRASSYIPLPKKLWNKKAAIVNIENLNDHKCFLYSVLAAKEKLTTVNPTDYDHLMETVDSSMLTYPVNLGQIDTFERANKLSINVLAYTKEVGLHPLHVNRNVIGKPIDLLMLTGDDGQLHYCAIIDIVKLLLHIGSGSHAKFYCRNCFASFGKEWMLLAHREQCFQINPAQALRFKAPGKNTSYFSFFNRQNPLPWAIYADFECVLQPLEITPPSPTKSSKTKIQRHVPCSFGYVVVGPKGEIINQKYYLGMDAVEVFLDSMVKEAQHFDEVLKDVKPLLLTSQEQQEFETAQYCFYCSRRFHPNPKTKGFQKTRDHCHITGLYRGPAHSKCNLSAREQRTIPVLFHNLEGYDAHVIVSAIHKFPGKVDVIARNAERFQSMTVTVSKIWVKLRFLDSYGFLSSPLEMLAANHKKDQRDFKILQTGLTKNDHWFGKNINELIALDVLTQKGYYPYEYMQNMKVFDKEELPPKEAFYSHLTEKGLTDDEYAHAVKMWKLLETKKLSSYHEVYQMTDVFLLADVFQFFRQVCLDNYKLDPCYYVSTPGFSWAAALRMTAANLELFTHAGKHNFIASGIRGGVSYIGTRFAEANNKHLPKTYNPSKPSKYIIYWDANNLYGWAMSQTLPYNGFQWLTRKEIDSFDVNSVSDDAEVGYILEVDLDYPGELHQKHNDYPLAPEKLEITEDLVSPYSKDQAKKLGHTIKSTTKLVPNLRNKKRYIVHYRNLKFYLKHGLVLRHTRRVLKFNQQPWMKKYINFNTRKRQQCTTEFEKSFFKLLNNSIFGKTLENKQKRLNVKLCTDAARAVKYSSLPHADSFRILNEELVQLNLKVRSVMCDLPTYSGFSILDLSKLFMYKFHYEYIQPKYGDKAKLLLTDTDSLCYLVETEDIYEDMRADSDRFDTSNYDSMHGSYSISNKQVLGKMKDELGGVPIQEFVGLKSKMYSVKAANVEEMKKAKGISKVFVKKHLSHENYKTVLTAKTTVEKGTWNQITSNSHELSTVAVSKSLLSPYDDKRFVLDDGITTFAIGHCNSNTRAEYEDDFDADVDVMDDEEAEERANVEGKASSAEVAKAKAAEVAEVEARRLTKLENRERKRENPAKWEEACRAKKREAEQQRRIRFTPREKQRRVDCERDRRSGMTEEEKQAARERNAKQQRLRLASKTEEEKLKMRTKKAAAERARRAKK